MSDPQSTPGSTPVLGCLGDIVEDIVVWQQRELLVGSDTPSRIRRTRGGSAANVADAAAELIRVRFIGCVADDLGGRLVTEALAARGVELCVRTTGSRTGTVVVLVSPDGERTMLPDRGANAELNELDPSWLADLTGLHVTSYALLGGPTAATALRALQDVKAHGGLTSLDVSSTNLIEELGAQPYLRLVETADPDVVFANEIEAALLGWDQDAPAERMLVIKHGPGPVRVRTRCGAATFQVTPVPAISDTTGAGDAFAAGFLAAVLQDPTRAGDYRQIRKTPTTDDRLARWCTAGHQSATAVLTQPGAGTDLV